MIESGPDPTILSARKPTRQIQVGTLAVGGLAPVSVQSMVKTPPGDVQVALDQIHRAAAAGADLMRVAVPDESSVQSLGKLTRASPLPLIADVHFRPDLALASMDAGVSCVRINPLTLPSKTDLVKVGRYAAKAGTAVRVGVNAARLDHESRNSPLQVVETALEALQRLQDCGVANLKVSVKSSDLAVTVLANRLLADRCDHPVHLGLTEAGPPPQGLVKSSTALGILLCEGIGDTVRISLTGDPVVEVIAGRTLLRCLGLSERGVDLVACPSCGRAHTAVAEAATTVQQALVNLHAKMTVAVMGCEVNGPGEAGQADVGIAATQGGWVLFREGEIVARLDRDEGPDRLIHEAMALARKSSDQ